MNLLPWKSHLFTQRYTFSHLDGPLDKRLGLTTERSKAVFEKLYAVARVAPQHSQIIESFMNYDKFTETEKMFGLFALGEVYGMVNMMKRLNVKKIKITLPVEMARLLQVISKVSGMPGALPGMGKH